MGTQIPPRQVLATSTWLWPRVDTLASAKRASRYGFWASLTLAGLLTVFITSSVGPGEVASGWAFLRPALFAVLALAILKGSAAAAVVALVEYAFGLADTWLVQGFTLSSVTIPVLFILAFVNSIRGTLAYRRLEAMARGGMPPASGRVLAPLWTAPIDIRKVLLNQGAAEASITAAKSSARYLAAFMVGSSFLFVPIIYLALFHNPISRLVNSPEGNQVALLIFLPLGLAALAGAIATLVGMILAILALFQPLRPRIISAFIFNGALIAVYSLLTLLAITEAA